jgi:hypothetical protein
MESKALIITDSVNNCNGFMTQLSGCFKINIPAIHMDVLDEMNIGFEPSIIIFDASPSPNMIRPCIQTISQRYHSAELIAVTENDTSLLENYKACGCMLVLSKPINLQTFMAHMNMSFNKPALG